MSLLHPGLKMQKVKIPVLGESISEATIGTITKKVGDFVKAGEVVLELETDKVNLEIAAEASGVIQSINYKVGDTVKQNDVFCSIEPATEGAKTTPSPSESAQKIQTPSSSTEKHDKARELPSASKLAREKGIDTSQIQGTGMNSAVTRRDLENYSPQATKGLGQEPSLTQDKQRNVQSSHEFPADPSGAEEIRVVRMTSLRRAIARRLKESQNTAATLTTYNEVDMSVVMELRKKYQDNFTKRHGAKLGFMSFFVKAVVSALKEMPIVNAEIQGDNIIYKDFVHVGVAIGSDAGLVVPVLRNTDCMGLADIEKAILDFAGKAKSKSLKLEDMTGGTFTISNGGTYGSLLSMPILNPPQSAILGMHKIQERPVVVSGQIVIRPMMYLALSYDHRLIDGKEAVTFLVRIKDFLEDPTRLLLEV